MTRHRKPEEWIQEILDAASAEIEEKGYPALTMESIARRTELSKGGVYRFFANKNDVALALFTSCYKESLVMDVDEAISWELPVAETFNRVLLQLHAGSEKKQGARRVWMHLLPEVLRDDRFRAERELLLVEIGERFMELAVRLLAREGLSVTSEVRTGIQASIKLGVALFEGFTIQSSLGGAVEQEELTRIFVDALVNNAMGPMSGIGEVKAPDEDSLVVGGREAIR